MGASVMELAVDAGAISNDECRNPKEARKPNDKSDVVAGNLRSSGFGFPSSFDSRHSDLYIILCIWKLFFTFDLSAAMLAQ